MPVEIRELVVKTTIENAESKILQVNTEKKIVKKIVVQVKDEIIEECVRRVTEIMERNKQR